VGREDETTSAAEREPLTLTHSLSSFSLSYTHTSSLSLTHSPTHSQMMNYRMLVDNEVLLWVLDSICNAGNWDKVLHILRAAQDSPSHVQAVEARLLYQVGSRGRGGAHPQAALPGRSIAVDIA
jgi:hypothetical protein